MQSSTLRDLNEEIAMLSNYACDWKQVRTEYFNKLKHVINIVPQK